MRATLLERAGVSRPVNETRRKRPTLFPLFLFAGTYSPLSKSVLSPVSYLRRRSSRVDGAVPIFFSSLLFFTDFRSDCQFQAQWKYILHLFNPEKGNVESIFLNME